MRRSRLFFQLLLVISSMTWAAVSVSAQASGNDADTAMIRKIWANYAAYVEKGDGNGWLSQYDAEGIQLRPDAPARTKQELDAQVPAAFKARVEANDVKMSINPIEIVVTGPWAYSRGTYTQDFTDKSTGQLTHVDGKFLTIFKKQADGTWKIFRDCFNSNVPPK
ncbi:MAG: nuclear transport factor 2 family protein [Spirochaetia bacterium]